MALVISIRTSIRQIVVCKYLRRIKTAGSTDTFTSLCKSFALGMLSYKSCVFLEGMYLNLNACSHTQIADSSKYWEGFFPFLTLICMYTEYIFCTWTQRYRFALFSSCWFALFSSCHLLEQRDSSSALIFPNSRVQIKDSGKQMLLDSHDKLLLLTL